MAQETKFIRRSWGGRRRWNVAKKVLNKPEVSKKLRVSEKTLVSFLSLSHNKVYIQYIGSVEI